MDLMPGISSTASALDAERTRLDVIAQNIANAQNTRDVNGLPYQRKQVVFSSMLQDAMQKGLPGGENSPAVKVDSIRTDNRPGPLVHMPGHPHANAQGMVQMPNVEVAREMVDMISASRAYEANLSVVSTSRQMARQVMSIGQR